MATSTFPAGVRTIQRQKKVRRAEAEGGDDVEAALGSRLVERKPKHGLEAGESVGAAEVHGVAIEGEPRAQGEGLGDDREIDAANAAPEREEAEDQCDDAGNHHHREESEERAAEGLPERGSSVTRFQTMKSGSTFW
jgi:hypothetical protein